MKKTHETILLVDDEVRVRLFLAGLLEHAGYVVLQAGDGEPALEISETYPGPIHLLVTDVMMPVMNGKELAQRLCSLRPEIKVLFISGYSREEAFPEDVCEQEIVDWLPKPFTAPQFHRKVRLVLDSVREEE
jgi:two-component system cell cycle sensor histidine kinase/response regulator CckA